MEKNKEQAPVKCSFSYTDCFGQESSLSKTFTADVMEVMDEMELLVSEFKNFLLASGHSLENVNKIQIVD